MKRVLRYVWKYRIFVIIPFTAMLLSIVLDMFNPYLTRLMIDKIIVGRDRSLLLYVLFGIGGISLSRSILGYVNEYVFDYLSALVHKDLKRDLFNHIQGMPFKYFDGMNTGELMSRMGEDIENVWRNISFGSRLFIENMIYFVMATIILILINWKLALVSLAAMPFIAFFALRLEKKIGEAYDKISDQTALLNTTAQENIAGVRLVKAFARERHEILKFLDMNKTSYKLNMEQANVVGKYFPVMEFLSNISIVIVVSVGGMFVIGDKLTIGRLVEFNGYMWMLIWPMRMLGWLTNVMAQSNASAKKIVDIMAMEPEIKSSEDDSIRLRKVEGHVMFKNVSFKYNNEYVLRNINLDAKPGDTIAIMGTTGSGKTSIVNLIARFYDASEGRVLFDGIDVRDLDLEQLRGSISYVSQDTFLFSETIEENVRMGKPDATMDEIRKACSDACIDDFISGLDEGYGTIIGERGIGLSGGQKQRISIARALLKMQRSLCLTMQPRPLILKPNTSFLKTSTGGKRK